MKGTRPQTYRSFRCPTCERVFTNPLPMTAVWCRGVERKWHPEKQMTPVKEDA